MIDFTWYLNSKKLSESEDKYSYNCESISYLTDQCSLKIKNFNLDSGKNSDNGVYRLEIRTDENNNKIESFNITDFMPKNKESNQTNETSTSNQNTLNHKENDIKNISSILENLKSHKTNNTFPEVYAQFPLPISSDDEYLRKYKDLIESFKSNFLDLNIQYLNELKENNTKITKNVINN